LTPRKRPHAAAHDLNIRTGYPPVGVVDHESWMCPQQTIPQCVQAFDPMILSDALPVSVIGGPPERQRANIAVLAIDINAPILDFLREEVRHPLKGFGVAEIEKSAQLAFVWPMKHPLRVIFMDETGGTHPSRFEPQKEF